MEKSIKIDVKNGIIFVDGKEVGEKFILKHRESFYDFIKSNAVNMENIVIYDFYNYLMCYCEDNKINFSTINYNC